MEASSLTSFLKGSKCPLRIEWYIFVKDSCEGKVTLNTLNNEMNRGSTSLRPPPGWKKKQRKMKCKNVKKKKCESHKLLCERHMIERKTNLELLR